MTTCLPKLPRLRLTGRHQHCRPSWRAEDGVSQCTNLCHWIGDPTFRGRTRPGPGRARIAGRTAGDHSETSMTEQITSGCEADCSTNIDAARVSANSGSGLRR